MDVLVNNAGIGGPDTDVVDTSLAEFRRVLEVNLTRDVPRVAGPRPG